MTTARTLFEFDHSYAREVPGLSLPWTAAPVPAKVRAGPASATGAMIMPSPPELAAAEPVNTNGR